MDLAIRRRRQEVALAMLGDVGGPCRIKLCGMFRDEDVAAVNACKPDMCGFICGYPKSPRNVHPPVEVKRLSDMVDGDVFSVLLSVDQRAMHTSFRANSGYADLIQLHGSEDEDYLGYLRFRLRQPVGIIQAFVIRDRADVERALASSADMVLLDAGRGSGTAFDWGLVDGFCERRPFILAGGLTPDNVAEAVRTLRPWGVDLSSGIETDGFKDPQKMAAAVAAVRSAS